MILWFLSDRSERNSPQQRRNPYFVLGDIPPTGRRFTPADCPSNTENRHAVSRILAGTKQHTPGRSNILPGSAPALHSVILYPYPSPSSPPYHPITLTPYPGAEPAPRPGCVSICLIFRREHCRFPHILRRNRWRTLEQDSRLGDPFRGPGRSLGCRLERPAHGHKKRALDGSKTLKKYYVMPPACASGLLRQAVRFSINRHIVGP